MTGMLAVSRAGHDKDTVYVITGEDGAYVYLADGLARTVEKPKRKNRKHIQVVKKTALQKPEDGFQDSEIRRAIKIYQEESNVKSGCN